MMADTSLAGAAILPAERSGLSGALARWLLWPKRGQIPPMVVAAQASGAFAGELVQVARDEGLAPWLHYRARQAGIVFAPAVAAALAFDYHASLSRNTYMFGQLAAVQRVAAAQGVDLLVLKGAHLAAWLYPSPATRPMVDVDLLVRREQAQKLVAALSAGDYRVVSREPRPGAGLEFENQLLLAHPGKSDYGCLALHWSLLDFPSYQRQLRMDGFWQRAGSCALPGMDARVLAGEDLLVYLCAHLALHHQWSRLIWLCDIALLLERVRDTLDWDRACALAESAELSLALGETLRRAVGILGAEVPAPVWTRLNAVPVGPAERYAWQAMTQSGRSAGRSFWSNLRAMHGVRSRLGFARAHLLPSPGYMRRRYQITSDWKLPAAYARRWLLGIQSLHSPKSGNLRVDRPTRI